MPRRSVHRELSQIEKALGYAEVSLANAESERFREPIRRYIRMLTMQWLLLDTGLGA